MHREHHWSVTIWLLVILIETNNCWWFRQNYMKSPTCICGYYRYNNVVGIVERNYWRCFNYRGKLLVIVIEINICWLFWLKSIYVSYSERNSNTFGDHRYTLATTPILSLMMLLGIIYGASNIISVKKYYFFLYIYYKILAHN